MNVVGLNINPCYFWLCIFAIAMVGVVVWPLPKGTKPHGLARAWRWITVASTLYFAYFSYPLLPYFRVITPVLWIVFVVLMVAALISAARQNCKSVWGRLLACLLLGLAIGIVLEIIQYG